MNQPPVRVSAIARVFSLAILLFFALVSSGCKTYRDPVLGTSGAVPSAVLIRKSPLMSDFVIYNIDGRLRPKGLISRYELLPGHRFVVVALNEGLYHGDKIKIEFEAKANQVYRVEADVRIFGGRWSAWITEESTGKRFIGEPIRFSR